MIDSVEDAVCIPIMEAYCSHSVTKVEELPLHLYTEEGGTRKISFCHSVMLFEWHSHVWNCPLTQEFWLACPIIITLMSIVIAV